ncbi:MAG TPA: outer membrane lipoprotein-sorting protein [Candidatus Acidoferrales bacterium]|nr:outer membrane lipoprotein-sorting protein [Candidatus Acidoferrales bacterium]
MIVRRFVSLLFVFAAIFGLSFALASANSSQNHSQLTLDSLLARLDDSARNFHSLSADVERTKVTVVVNDRSTETGTILVRGDRMLLELKTPALRTILRNGDNLFIYEPGLKRVEEFNLGKNRGLVDQFLLLGFGTGGKELRRGYGITLVGETLIDDRKTVELELAPKSEDVLKQFSKIQIWFDQSNWLPLQQQLFEAGSGDYMIVRYSKMVRNPNIPDSAFKSRWPKGTEKIKH